MYYYIYKRSICIQTLNLYEYSELTCRHRSNKVDKIFKKSHFSTPLRNYFSVPRVGHDRDTFSSPIDRQRRNLEKCRFDEFSASSLSAPLAIPDTTLNSRSFVSLPPVWKRLSSRRGWDIAAFERRFRMYTKVFVTISGLGEDVLLEFGVASSGESFSCFGQTTQDVRFQLISAGSKNTSCWKWYTALTFGKLENCRWRVFWWE